MVVTVEFVLILITSYVGVSWGFGLQIGGFNFNLPLIGNSGNGSPSSQAPGPPGLQVGFYEGRCPDRTVDVEALVATTVQEQFRKDPTILPALLRMQFHDCFVHGCDASILIAGTSSEKNADANLTVRGYEFIDAVKAALEAECPGIVSCADIIAIATKVAIKLGGGPDYVVQTGRRDGLTSSMDDVNLPSPFIPVSQSISAFRAKNFNAEEMVVLLGCHTVGVAHCEFFQDRLYNDNDQFDPNMDPNLRKQLMLACPKGSSTSNNVAFLDQNPQSSNTVDNSFFGQIKRNRGILPIDQALSRDPNTSAVVKQLSLDDNIFNIKLASAMIKLQALDVLTGTQGEIRKVCSQFN